MDLVATRTRPGGTRREPKLKYRAPRVTVPLGPPCTVRDCRHLPPEALSRWDRTLKGNLSPHFASPVLYLPTDPIGGFEGAPLYPGRLRGLISTKRRGVHGRTRGWTRSTSNDPTVKRCTSTGSRSSCPFPGDHRPSRRGMTFHYTPTEGSGTASRLVPPLRPRKFRSVGVVPVGRDETILCPYRVR